jgi:hypothetical protein
MPTVQKKWKFEAQQPSDNPRLICAVGSLPWSCLPEPLPRLSREVLLRGKGFSILAGIFGDAPPQPLRDPLESAEVLNLQGKKGLENQILLA